MENRIGHRIRRIREGLDISREQLAERSSLSLLQVEKIESDELIPSLTPLIRISRALGVRLGTFMDDCESEGPSVFRGEERASGINFSNESSQSRTAMTYFPLAADKAGRHMEPFVIDIAGGSDEHILSTHEGEEFIYVLAGEIEIEYGKDVYSLSAGDSIYYDSIVPHHVHAKNGVDAKIIAVVYVPV